MENVFRLDGTRGLDEYRVVVLETMAVLLETVYRAHARKFQSSISPRTAIQQLREHREGRCHWEFLEDENYTDPEY